MHISVVVTDFDGTVSEGDRLAKEACRILRRLREAGWITVLASGRSFEFLHDLQEREQVFDLIVAENGAVLYNCHIDEVRLPFGEVPGDLLDMLDELGVPLWRGSAIAGTTMEYDDAVWVASRELGLPVHVETNRNEVMLLPPGVSKGAGLLRLLEKEGLSPRNVLAFGDAENDWSLLEVAELKVAVANAISSLKTAVDYVTEEAGPAGVAAFAERYLLGGKDFDFPVRGAHHFNLGAADGLRVNAYDLVDRNLLIAGGSGYGKSWLASRLAAGLIDGGYQVLGLDPVGDLGTLRRHATCLCLGREMVPSIDLVVQLLAETELSLLVDLSTMETPEERVLYTAGLLRRVLDVYRRYGKPHWLVVDEAQDVLGGEENPAWLLWARVSRAPGTCLVTWRPSRLREVVRDKVDGFLLTRHRLGDELACLSDLLADREVDVSELEENLGALSEGEALVWGLSRSAGDTPTPLKFGVGPRTFSKMRRLHRYVEERASPSRQFYFHEEARETPPAGNLSDLIDRMETLGPEVIEFHFRRGDFSRWVRDVLHDEALARWLDRLQTTDLSGEGLRQALLEDLEHRHRALERFF